MIVNRVRDRQPGRFGQVWIELLHSGVESANDALQLGKFLYQFRGQISLCQTCGLVNHAGADRHSVLANDFAHPTGDALNPQRLVVIAAQIFLESDILQPLHSLPQRMLLVGLPEEARIVETGPQHAFMAVSYDAVGIAVGIQHGEKMWKELAAGVFNRKIFLMIAHHGDQNFLGQFEKLRIEAAEDR